MKDKKNKKISLKKCLFLTFCSCFICCFFNKDIDLEYMNI